MPTKYLHIDGHAIYLHYAGKTTLPDVVPDFTKGRKIIFIHGAGGNGHGFHKELSHLATSHSPMAPDLPGHGRSSGVEGLRSVRDYSDFVAILLDKLKIRSAVIGGHSMGGAIAMDFAIRHPDRVEALILIATAAKFSIPKDRIEGMRAVMMGRASQAFTTDNYSPKTVKESFDVVREGWMEQVKTDPRVCYTDMVACDECDVRNDIAKITHPTLILAGADDNSTTAADAQAIASKIKSAQVNVIADGGHALPLERPAEVNAAIDSFLAGLK
jgi:pimeloyl-ACP methyl ester carboxylesterase